MKVLLKGFLIVCCFAIAQSKGKKSSDPAEIVQCGDENEKIEQHEDDFLHGHREFPKKRKESDIKTGFCVNIPQQYGDRGNRGITEFTWNLFKNSNDQEDFVLSPMTPQLLLSYLAWIAAGKTKDEIVSASVYSSPESIQRTFDGLLRDGSKRELQIASAFFVANDITLNQRFVDQADGNAEIISLNFTNPEESSRVFEKWAKSKTKNGLKLNEIKFEPNSKMTMASAFYFKANWHYRFPPATKGTFQSPDGEIEVDMLKLKKKFRWGKISDYAEWCAIPYESEDSMVIVLPNKDKTLDDLIKTFDQKALVDLLYDFERESTKADVTLTMPKFKLESTTNLIPPLNAMGVKSLFTPGASLPYFSNSSGIFIASADQQASIDVNEEGTIAVSLTVFHAVSLSVHVPIPAVDFVVDRPFLAIIANRNRNIPYVIAKVSRPKYE